MIAHARLKQLASTPRIVQGGLSQDDLTFLKDGYVSMIPRGPGVDASLTQILDYVLDCDGSFLRAQLGFMSMRCAGASREDARRFGVAVEYFHTASLLFDDLPAMDDGSHRRGRLCPHLEFSEADAMLAGLALITHAYDLVFQVMVTRPAAYAQAARKVLVRCLGARGILSGQSADLHFQATRAAGDDVLDIATGKTGTLLLLLLQFPAVLYGVPTSVARQLGELAWSWGIGYQVLDDFKDLAQSEQESGKTPGRDAVLEHPNYVSKVGRDSAWRRLTRELAASQKRIQALADADPAWKGLWNIQTSLAFQADRVNLALGC